MEPITLSYITATKNKLPYLKDRLEKLMAAKKKDDEILVADGGSTDGTKEYLEELKLAGKIDYFTSSPDCGESHAMNKLQFVARGTLIKLITDDDVFHYSTIALMKAFMLDHPEIDLVGSNGGSFKHETPSKLSIRQVAGYEENYQKWKKQHVPFDFSGLGSMWRRSSLPVIGLWDPSFRSADTEFTLRVTAGKANVAWYTGCSFVFVKNLQSTTWVNRKKVKDEVSRLYTFYFGKDPDASAFRILKRTIKKIISALRRLLGRNIKEPDFRPQWQEQVATAEAWLHEKSKESRPAFLVK